jgi:NAD(P)-dependent dehydrogenase (short-subunit alcohol dehydrogenase family)
MRNADASPALAEALACEMKAFGVRVATVKPGTRRAESFALQNEDIPSA